jgi:von Willebrand factor type A domain
MKTPPSHGWLTRVHLNRGGPRLGRLAFLYHRQLVALGLGLCLGLVGPGCGRPTPVGPIVLPKTEPHPGTAVEILVDTSGSMKDSVPNKDGVKEPKSKLAREALQRILKMTGDWKKSNPANSLDLGVSHFANSVSEVLPMGAFDQGKAETALGRIGAPNGGTAIGLALQEGFKSLYRSGCTRKFLVCITDGENTVGPNPEVVARQLHEQTKGDVTIFFVAFDTSAVHFKFLSGVNGQVIEAADGGQLQKELAKIYEERILLETPIKSRP